MKHRIIASAAVALVSMSGCNSLNTQTNIYVSHDETVVWSVAPAASATPAAPALAASVAASVPAAPLVEPKQADGTPQLCPVYRAPVFTKIPELPIKEIQAVGPGNPARIEEIERHHIEELRSYILSMQSSIARARNQYQRECRPYLKK